MREDWERVEALILAPQAAHSVQTAGRLRLEEPCPLRTCYQRDRDRIIHSKAFRRLKQKTQVFIAPEKDHFRTRLTHTLEVAQISRTIARGLRLNEDLTEAIALGHDLGHTPFGHGGERSLAKHYPGFRHNKQSLRVVDDLEKDGVGLNLTWEVRDGILHHSGSQSPVTLEGKIVHISDRIAYINHDIDDAIRAGIIREAELPQAAQELWGNGSSKRINGMVLDLVQNSADLEDIRLSPPVQQTMDELRQFLFDNVYWRQEALDEEKKVQLIIDYLCLYYSSHPQLVPQEKDADLDISICDYIAGMTDRFALEQYSKLGGPPLTGALHRHLTGASLLGEV